MRTPIALIAAALIAGVAACGSPSHSGKDANPSTSPKPVGVEIAESSLGPILTDQDGRTLYAFVNDKDGSSSCTGQCIATWPALVSKKAVAAGPGVNKTLLSQTNRAEGTTQATYGD